MSLLCRGRSQSQSQVKSDSAVKSLIEVLAEVKNQVEFDCFSDEDKAHADSICLIIAEVSCLPKAAQVRIGRNDLPAFRVAEAYSLLEHEHLQFVIEQFARATYEIKFKKTYLRTMLYNSIFEYDAHYTNAVSKDMPYAVSEPFGKKDKK